MEIDIAKKTLRAVEAAGTDHEMLGPGQRAYSLLHAFTGADGASRVLCGYGYTSLDERTNT
jgi:hypothetical protein